MNFEKAEVAVDLPRSLHLRWLSFATQRINLKSVRLGPGPLPSAPDARTSVPNYEKGTVLDRRRGDISPSNVRSTYVLRCDYFCRHWDDKRLQEGRTLEHEAVGMVTVRTEPPEGAELEFENRPPLAQTPPPPRKPQNTFPSQSYL